MSSKEKYLEGSISMAIEMEEDFCFGGLDDDEDLESESDDEDDE